MNKKCLPFSYVNVSTLDHPWQNGFISLNCIIYHSVGVLETYPTLYVMGRGICYKNDFLKDYLWIIWEFQIEGECPLCLCSVFLLVMDPRDGNSSI